MTSLLITLCIIALVCQMAAASDASNWHRTELVQLQQTFLKMARKVRAVVAKYNNDKIALNKRNLVVYHINEVNTEKDSRDIAYNNLQLFISSILQHSNQSDHKAFYIFNDAGGSLVDVGRLIPSDRENVAHVVWPKKCNEKDTPLKTVLQLGPSLYTNFTSVFVVSDKSRGPMAGAKDGKWIHAFRYLLDRNDVGVVGSSFSCDPMPHIQPHMYALRMDVLVETASKFNGPRKPQSSHVVQFFMETVGEAVSKLNYRQASVLYYIRDQQEFFENKCLADKNAPGQMVATSNPATWCNLAPEEAIFVKWGGVPLRPPVLLCREHVEKVLATTAKLAEQNPQLHLHLPEVHARGVIYELFKQFGIEQWRNRYLPQLIVAHNHTQQGHRTAATDVTYATALTNPRPHMVDTYRESAQKVCFLVRVLPKQDSDPSVKRSSVFSLVDVEEMIQSLLRQTNPNWRAMFVLNSGPTSAKFSKRMVTILQKYEDVRLKLVEGYMEATTNAMELDRLTTEMQHYEDCTYGTVTAGDNLYGSEVVQNVLNAYHRKGNGNGGSQAEKGEAEGVAEVEEEVEVEVVPKVVFAPYDSRATAELEMTTRNALRNQPDFWLEQCVSFDAMFAAHTMPYTIQPNAMAGRIELSGVFLLKDALVAEKIKFGQVPIPETVAIESHCMGCEAAVLIQHLLRAKQWPSVKLPIDGLKSVVFEGPSPTWCVASGKVWFDYPDHQKTGCVDHRVLKQLQERDSKEKPFFDWKYSYSRHKICLRLSEHGYANRGDIFYTR